jgi:hypothetical protein
VSETPTTEANGSISCWLSIRRWPWPAIGLGLAAVILYITLVPAFLGLTAPFLGQPLGNWLFPRAFEPHDVEFPFAKIWLGAALAVQVVAPVLGVVTGALLGRLVSSWLPPVLTACALAMVSYATHQAAGVWEGHRLDAAAKGIEFWLPNVLSGLGMRMFALSALFAILSGALAALLGVYWIRRRGLGEATARSPADGEAQAQASCEDAGLPPR